LRGLVLQKKSHAQNSLSDFDFMASQWQGFFPKQLQGSRGLLSQLAMVRPEQTGETNEHRLFQIHDSQLLLF
jgi:hypothetical protein